MGFLSIPHHEVQQLGVFQDPILAVGKTFLDIVVVIFVIIQKGLQSVPNKRGEDFVRDRLQGDWPEVIHFSRITFFVQKDGYSLPPSFRGVLRLPAVYYDVM